MDDSISTKGKQSRETGGKFVFLLFAGVVRFPISKLDKEIYARNIISHAVSGRIERFRTTIGWQRNIL